MVFSALVYPITMWKESGSLLHSVFITIHNPYPQVWTRKPILRRLMMPLGLHTAKPVYSWELWLPLAMFLLLFSPPPSWQKWETLTYSEPQLSSTLSSLKTFNPDTSSSSRWVLKDSTLGISGPLLTCSTNASSPIFNIWRRTWAAEEPIFLLSLANSAFRDVALPLIYGLTGIVLVHSPELVKCSGENFLETCSSWCTVGDPSREKGSRGRHVSKSQLWNAIVWWPRVVDLPAHSVLV